MLTEQDVSQYRTHGYLLKDGLIDPAMIAEARRVIGEFVARSVDVTGHTDVFDLEPGHSAQDPRVRRIKTPHKQHNLFAEMMRAPRLVEALKQLLGPSGVRLHGSKINLKSPRYGSPVEWHQDWAFYPHTNDDVLAVGVLLDDATIENGALLVLPGTHTGPIYDHHADGFFCGAMDPERDGLDLAAAVPLVAKAGAVSFHHARTVHGSAQNRSDRPRQLLLYEYTAADAFPLMGIKDLAEFDSRLIVGKPTIEPRLADVPVRMPLPPARHQGSIYENQTSTRSRYFEVKTVEMAAD